MPLLGPIRGASSNGRLRTNPDRSVAVSLVESTLLVTQTTDVLCLFAIDAAVAHVKDEMCNLLVLVGSLIPLRMRLFNDGNQDADIWISLLYRRHFANFNGQKIRVTTDRTVYNFGVVFDHVMGWAV